MNTPERSTAADTVPAHLMTARMAKVRDSHLSRKAIVYVSQSSPQQIVEHKESTARQYALADLAVALGWSPDRVEIVDRDQGRSGQTTAGRLGFQYILAELGLDHVGLVLGLEASRLARSDPDWAPLVRLCGVFRALLCDYDGLYDPNDFNDRLLLRNKWCQFIFRIVKVNWHHAPPFPLPASRQTGMSAPRRWPGFVMEPGPIRRHSGGKRSTDWWRRWRGMVKAILYQPRNRRSTLAVTWETASSTGSELT